MPFVDHARREIRLKVVYYGPGLGGKTTNLEYIHAHSRPTHRGKLITLNTDTERTLFFDLLPVELGEYKGFRVRCHLCTVPGQIAHDEVRRMVLTHADGIVFVVDSQADRMPDNWASLLNLQVNLERQGDDPSRMPLAVQYNKQDLPSALPPLMLSQRLKVDRGVPQIEACATEGRGVFETFRAILTACLDIVAEPHLAPAGRSPSIVPGRRLSMFPEALPKALADTFPPAPRVPSVPDSGAPQD